MKDDATARLEDRFDEYEILGRLHDVPPHEVWEVEVAGRRAVLKFDTGPTGSAGVEGRVLTFVDAQTSVLVPAVLETGGDFFVTAWHPDAPDPATCPESGEAWARAAGGGLATLHAETARHIDQFGRVTRESNRERLVVDGHDDWHAAAMEYVRRLAGVLGEFGHADVATAVFEQLRKHPDAYQDSGGPVLCHGWWTPEHVAVAPDGSTGGSTNGSTDCSTKAAVQCVVDWEHAMAAPGEWDYWRTVLATFDDENTHSAFREGYDSVRPLPVGVEDRRPMFLLLVWLYYFESLYVQAQHDQEETEKRASFLRERVFEMLDGA